MLYMEVVRDSDTYNDSFHHHFTVLQPTGTDSCQTPVKHFKGGPRCKETIIIDSPMKTDTSLLSMVFDQIYSRAIDLTVTNDWVFRYVPGLVYIPAR